MEQFDVPPKLVEEFFNYAPAGWLKLVSVYFRGSGSLSSSGFDLKAVWRDGHVEFEQTTILSANLYSQMGRSIRAMLPGDWRQCVVSVDVAGSVSGTFERGGEDEDLDMSKSPLLYLLHNEVAELTELGERVYGPGSKRRFWQR